MLKLPHIQRHCLKDPARCNSPIDIYTSTNKPDLHSQVVRNYFGMEPECLILAFSDCFQENVRTLF